MDKVFAAEYNSCIYESGFSVLSLHRTPEGADAAITKHKAKVLREWKKAGQQAIPDYERWQVRKIKLLD